MQWDDARIFLAFAREGSFGAAARRLGVQHSTISRRIHALEKDLATPLVERSPTGYVLTKAGESLSQSASNIEKELLSFEASSAGQDNDISGALRVTAIANMASSILMPIFARFANTYPNIDFNLEVTNNSVRLAERDADVALRQTNVPGETLIGTRLTTVGSAVYGSVEYCAAISAGDASEKWLGVNCCDYHRSWTKEARPQADHSFCVDETALTVAALKEGLGVGYLPCFIGDCDPNLVRFIEPDDQHNLGLWFLYHRDLKSTKRIMIFREFMKTEVAKLRPLLEGLRLQSFNEAPFPNPRTEDSQEFLSYIVKYIAPRVSLHV